MSETFESAINSFRAFVKENGCPPDIAWIEPEHVIARPGAVYVWPIRPNAGEELARESFERATLEKRAVLFHALFCSNGVTLCHSWLPLNDGESGRYLMPQKGVKMSVPTGEHRPRVYTVRSRIRWLLLRLLYRKYDAVRDLLFNIEH